MVRFGPGFDVDEERLDPRLGQASLDALQARRLADHNIVRFYLHYLEAALGGDLGTSRTLNQPVRLLIAQRLPTTLVSLGFGILGGVIFAFALAFLTLLWRAAVFDLSASIVSGFCLSIPSAVVALLFLWAGAPGRWAIALVVFPHVYRYARNILSSMYASPHVLMAFAKGLRTWRVLLMHVVVPAAPQLAAIAGISVSLAFGASIPVEVICDSPGIGQLAWKAAVGRDLPLLVGISMLIALMTLIVNNAADMFLEAQSRT